MIEPGTQDFATIAGDRIRLIVGLVGLRSQGM